MINLRAPLNQLGYGIVSTNLLKALSELDEVTLFPIGKPQVDQSLYPLLEKTIKNQDIFDCNAPTLNIWHQFAAAERIGWGRNVYLPFFELNKLTERESRHLDAHDCIIQASQWGANIVKDALPNKDIRVVKMGVDSKTFAPINLMMDKPYRFLYVSKIEIRKGHDILADLFNRAFSKDDNVELYISWQNPFLDAAEHKKWEDMYKETELGEKIFFIPRKQDIRNEYIAADCYIAPTRAESIGLSILEAMSMNKPVITTNYSGQTSFCNKDTSFLVDIDEMEPANDNIWFHGDAEWAKIGDKQEVQFIEYMRHCYKNKINTNPAGRAMAEILDWKNVAKQIMEILHGNN